MESPADLLAVLPALVTALALLLSWLLLKRGLSPEPPVEASGVPEPAAVPQEAPEEPAAVKPVGAEAEEATDTGQEEELDPEGERSLPQEEPEEEDGDTFSFKYSPGKLRGNQYKQMMTKEELREEQRVQREQLDAIFKLMKDNEETFGEMSDGDLKEQLRLYDM